jgi:hypothetical protein
MALNLVNVATITGSTSILLNPTTSSTAFSPSVTPAAGKLIRLNSVYVCNTTSGALTANLFLNRSGTDHALASSLACAANTTTVIVIKDSPIYLEETTDILKASGSATGLSFTASYDLLA